MRGLDTRLKAASTVKYLALGVKLLTEVKYLVLATRLHWVPSCRLLKNDIRSQDV